MTLCSASEAWALVKDPARFSVQFSGSFDVFPAIASSNGATWDAVSRSTRLRTRYAPMNERRPVTVVGREHDESVEIRCELARILPQDHSQSSSVIPPQARFSECDWLKGTKYCIVFGFRHSTSTVYHFDIPTSAVYYFNIPPPRFRYSRLLFSLFSIAGVCKQSAKYEVRMKQTKSITTKFEVAYLVIIRYIR